MVVSLSWLVALWACSDPLLDQGVLPENAPAVVLLAELDADGDVDATDAVQGELHLDLDGVEDAREAFRYAVVDADGERLYERTTNGPVIVREFLGYWSETAGSDLLAAFPELGRFPVTVPLLDEGREVSFEIRDDDGVYQEVGSYRLSRVEDDDLGTSEAVVGSETLLDNGDPAHRLDVVLLGDGYTEDQLDDWRADADALAAHLVEDEPLSGYAGYLNIHRVDVVSNQSGASYECLDDCESRDTAFGSIFPVELVNALLGTDYSSRAVIQQQQWEVARAATVVPWDLAIVVVNTERRTGMAVHYATVGTGGDEWLDVGTHEFGHLLGLLGDEYLGDACIRSDSLGLPVNITDQGTAPPWSHWVDPDTPLPTPSAGHRREVGTFEGAYNCDDLYRPMASCRMNDSGEAFCPVCTEALVRRLFRFVDPVDSLDVVRSGGTVSVLASGVDDDVVLELWAGDEVLAVGTVAEPPSAVTGAAEVVVRAVAPAPEVLDDPLEDLVQTRTFGR